VVPKFLIGMAFGDDDVFTAISSSRNLFVSGIRRGNGVMEGSFVLEMDAKDGTKRLGYFVSSFDFGKNVWKETQ
jgi:hypothetical protein